MSVDVTNSFEHKNVMSQSNRATGSVDQYSHDFNQNAPPAQKTSDNSADVELTGATVMVATREHCICGIRADRLSLLVSYVLLVISALYIASPFFIPGDEYVETGFRIVGLFSLAAILLNWFGVKKGIKTVALLFTFVAAVLAVAFLARGMYQGVQAFQWYSKSRSVADDKNFEGIKRFEDISKEYKRPLTNNTLTTNLRECINALADGEFGTLPEAQNASDHLEGMAPGVREQIIHLPTVDIDSTFWLPSIHSSVWACRTIGGDCRTWRPVQPERNITEESLQNDYCKIALKMTEVELFHLFTLSASVHVVLGMLYVFITFVSWKTYTELSEVAAANSGIRVSLTVFGSRHKADAI